MYFVSVALKCPLYRVFDYQVSLAYRLTLGVRVLVPFGKRKLVGIVLQVKDETDVPSEKVRSILKAIDTTPVITKSHLTFLQFAASYYCSPVGETLFAALPAALRQGDDPDKTAIEMYRVTIPEISAV